MEDYPLEGRGELEKQEGPNNLEINVFPISKSDENISGEVFFLRKNGRLEDFLLPLAGKKYSLSNFNASIEKTKQDILYYQETLKNKLGYNAKLIFDSYRLILDDEQFVGKISSLIRKEISPPQAVVKVAKEFIDFFYNSNFSGLREKIIEIRDLATHLLFNLREEKNQASIKNNIAVVDNMFPSDILKIAIYGVKAIISLKRNGTTNHSRIILNSLKLPYVEVEAGGRKVINEDDSVYLDFNNNKLFINSKKVVVKNSTKERARPAQSSPRNDLVKTKDDVEIKVHITINFNDEIKHGLVPLAKGIGLFRTEFLFLIGNAFLSEEEQISIYKNVLEKIKSKTIYIRLLDLGGDKQLPLKTLSKNLGEMETGKDDAFVRGIRYLMHNPHLLTTQLRALFKANEMVQGKPLNLIVPFVSSVDELIYVRRKIERVLKELKHQENHLYRLGMMVEIPAVIWNLAEIGKQVDFFSIGSNDIVSNLLAVKNDYSLKDSDYIHNPIFYHYMHKLVSELKSFGRKEIILCGELGEKVEFLEFLIGIGITHLSIDISSLKKVVDKISKLSLKEAGKKVKVILQKKSVQEIKKELLNC